MLALLWTKRVPQAYRLLSMQLDAGWFSPEYQVANLKISLSYYQPELMPRDKRK